MAVNIFAKSRGVTAIPFARVNFELIESAFKHSICA